MLRSAHFIFTYSDIYLAGCCYDTFGCIEKYVNNTDGLCYFNH